VFALVRTGLRKVFKFLLSKNRPNSLNFACLDSHLVQTGYCCSCSEWLAVLCSLACSILQYFTHLLAAACSTSLTCLQHLAVPRSLSCSALHSSLISLPNFAQSCLQFFAYLLAAPCTRCSFFKILLTCLQYLAHLLVAACRPCLLFMLTVACSSCSSANSYKPLDCLFTCFSVSCRAV